MDPASSASFATKMRSRRVLLACGAMILLHGCASIAGLEELEVVPLGSTVSDGSVDASGGSAGDASYPSESGDASGAGGHDASAEAAAGSSGVAGTAGTSGTAGASGSAGTSGSGGASGSAGASGSSGAAGSAPCSAGSTCVAPPAGGWSSWKPGWLALGKQVPCAPPGALAQLYDTDDQPAAPPAQCSCGCGTPTGDCVSTLECSTLAGCGLPMQLGQVSASCIKVSSPAAFSGCVASSPTAKASCAPSSSKVVPPSNWAPNRSACTYALSDLPLCLGDGRCTAATPDGAIGPCISSPGDLPCPGTVWSQRFVLSQSIADTRDCNSAGCSCAPLQASCTCPNDCTVQILNNGCGGALVQTLPATGTCISISTALPALFGAVLANASPSSNEQCAASGQAAPTGAITGSAPVTVCCQ